MDDRLIGEHEFQNAKNHLEGNDIEIGVLDEDENKEMSEEQKKIWKEWFQSLNKKDQKKVLKQLGLIKDPIKSEKVGRNHPCPCGSGKKYKKCCYLKG